MEAEGFYAANNQFQKSGPKGFIEVKILENDNLYVRVDLPGVRDEGVHCRIDGVRKKLVFFSGVGGMVPGFDESCREYSGSVGLGCDCCELTAVNPKVQDGVLRMILSRVKVKNTETKCTAVIPAVTGGSGRYLEDHPYVMKGNKRVFYAKPKDGGLYARIDLPGASAADTKVFLFRDEVRSEVRFYAETKKVSEHDESSRVYLGSFNHCENIDAHEDWDVDWHVKDGVLRMFLPPAPPRPPPPADSA